MKPLIGNIKISLSPTSVKVNFMKNIKVASILFK